MELVIKEQLLGIACVLHSYSHGGKFDGKQGRTQGCGWCLGEGLLLWIAGERGARGGSQQQQGAGNGGACDLHLPGWRTEAYHRLSSLCFCYFVKCL